MLADKTVAATVAVRDMARARCFYEDVLGLTGVSDMGDEVRVYRSGSGELLVYASPDTAGTGRATAATWGLGEAFDAVMADLKAKGVVFEHYDDLGLTREGDVHLGGDGFKAAWFKDPDGNILHVNSG